MDRIEVPKASTALVEQLCRLLADALGVSRIEPGADFFELGGDSLDAVKVTATIQDVFSVDLDLTAILYCPTADGLAAELRRLGVPDVLDGGEQ